MCIFKRKSRNINEDNFNEYRIQIFDSKIIYVFWVGSNKKLWKKEEFKVKNDYKECIRINDDIILKIGKTNEKSKLELKNNGLEILRWRSKWNRRRINISK